MAIIQGLAAACHKSEQHKIWYQLFDHTVKLGDYKLRGNLFTTNDGNRPTKPVSSGQLMHTYPD